METGGEKDKQEKGFPDRILCSRFYTGESSCFSGSSPKPHIIKI